MLSLTLIVGAVATSASESETSGFEYKRNGATKYTDDVSYALSMADSGTEVIAHEDILLEWSYDSAVLNLDGVSLNLNGHTLTLIQHANSSGTPAQAYIDVKSDVTVSDGTITIATDVDWSGAHIIIDDSGIDVDELCTNVEFLTPTGTMFRGMKVYVNGVEK